MKYKMMNEPRLIERILNEFIRIKRHKIQVAVCFFFSMSLERDANIQCYQLNKINLNE